VSSKRFKSSKFGAEARPSRSRLLEQRPVSPSLPFRWLSFVSCTLCVIICTIKLPSAVMLGGAYYGQRLRHGRDVVSTKHEEPGLEQSSSFASSVSPLIGIFPKILGLGYLLGIWGFCQVILGCFICTQVLKICMHFKVYSQKYGTIQHSLVVFSLLTAGVL